MIFIDFEEATQDNSPPVTIDNYDGVWHNSDLTINLTATDSSGIAATYYRVNGGAVQSVGANGQPRITVESGSNTLEYWSVDTVGNEEPHKTLTQIKLDKSAPTGSIQMNGGAAYTNTTTVNLSLSATDAISGISQMRFSNDNNTWSTWESYSTSKSWSLQAGDGVKNTFVQYKDTASLVTTFNTSITLDTTLPVANAGQSQTVNSGSSVTFNAGGSTDNTAIISYTWVFGDGATGTGITTTHSYSTAGTYTARLTVQDAAGNTATATVTITVQTQQSSQGTTSSSPSSSSSSTPEQAPSPSPTPTPNPTPEPEPIPTPEPTPIKKPEQKSEQPLYLYAIAVAVAFAIISATAFLIKKRQQPKRPH
jgi:PKD repeat protein